MEHRWVLRSFVFAVVATVLLSVPAGSAMAGERKWRVRLMGAFAGDQDGVVITSDDHSFTGVIIDSGIGGGINFEYRYSQRMGFESCRRARPIPPALDSKGRHRRRSESR